MDRAVAALRAFVRIPTVSSRDPAQVDTAAFDALLEELVARYPQLHAELEIIRVPTHGLLVRWPGASDERPVVLMAHLDVVPVDTGAPWQHPPFGGDLIDGQVWGRGTLDDKGSVVAICEAVESLLENGFRPAHDVWLSFGSDEEVTGSAARAAVAELQQRGIRPWFVLDEGGAVAHDAFPGVDAPIAVVGVAEKGATAIDLVVEGRGGHASTPARNGPTTRLARAVLRLERSPFPPSVPDPTVELLRRLAPLLTGPARSLRPVLTNGSRIRPVLARALAAAGPETAAMTRTTVAVTTLSGSPAVNVIASTARAGLNVRVMPGDTVADVVAHVRKAVRDDGVRVEVVEAGEASPVSTWDGDPAYELLEAVIGEVFPDAVPSPYVMTACTDSRFFTAICDRVYRFAPFRMTKEQRESIHSYDERIGVDDLLAGVTWYRRLIEGLG